MMPCESWPARLALTQPMATALASSSDAPAAFNKAVPIRVRRSAWTIGMGPPLEPPGVLLVVGAGPACSQRGRAIAISNGQILGCNAAGATLTRAHGQPPSSSATRLGPTG